MIIVYVVFHFKFNKYLIKIDVEVYNLILNMQTKNAYLVDQGK